MSDGECGKTRIDLARVLRATLQHMGELLELDPWLPVPQSGCTFLFGERKAPLPIGALQRILERVQHIEGECLSCHGFLMPFVFGGLKKTGGVKACCLECGRVFFLPVGNAEAVAQYVGPALAGTPFAIAEALDMEARLGPRRPLWRALRSLGVNDLPDEAWAEDGDPLEWSTIERSGGIGVGRPGGLSRLALSDADREMRDQFVSWCREAGCAVTIDRPGSIFARRGGADADLPPVIMGSHLDTQVNGGKFDGVLGVLAGLEVIRTLNDYGVATRRPIELVSWTNEEGARFSPPMVASGAFAGVSEVQWVLERLDDDDKRFGDELRRIGYAGSAPVGGRTLDAYFELHIEQGSCSW